MAAMPVMKAAKKILSPRLFSADSLVFSGAGTQQSPCHLTKMLRVPVGKFAANIKGIGAVWPLFAFVSPKSLIAGRDVFGRFVRLITAGIRPRP
jgi:hypothetical protein